MPTLRDALLPVADALRQLPQTFGLRRYAVTIRRRTWSGTYPGDGTPTNEDIVLSPIPRVRNSFSASSGSQAALQYLQANGNIIDDRYYTLSSITPAYDDGEGHSGGYTPKQLRIRASPDLKNVEEIVVLVGDDGFKRDCVQVTFEQDRAFRYTMLVHESDRPRAALSSIAITPNPVSVGVSGTAQLTADGTFADDDTSDITPLCVWQSSDSTVATVDLLGVVTGTGSGTASITASLTGVAAVVSVTVV